MTTTTTKKPAMTKKLNGAMGRALLRAEMKQGGATPPDAAAFKAVWAERREEMLTQAGVVLQSLKRQGFELSEIPGAAQDDATD